MRVAVVGGTGFVGSYIVDELIDQGHAVSLLVRPGSEHKVRHPEAIRVVSGTINSASSISDLVSACDAVIYCVGILRENRQKGITFESTQFDGVAQTLEAALEQGVKRFLLMSANGVKSPGTRYQESKKRAEDLVHESTIDSTVFRPSVIFGNPRGRMEFATQLFRDMVQTPIPAVGFFSGLSPSRGAVRMSPVHVKDVAQAFVKSLTDASTVGETYKLGGPEVLSWTMMIQRIAAATGRKKWIIPMPIALMKLAASLLDWLDSFPVTRDQLTMLAEGNIVDPLVLTYFLEKSPATFSFEHLDYLLDLQD